MKKEIADSFTFEIVLKDGVKRAKIIATQYYNHFIKQLSVGQKGTMYLTLKKPTRTENQLRYYWVICGLLAENCGYKKEEMHEWLMIMCFGTKKVTVNGITKEVRRSISNTAKMTNAECQELIEFSLSQCMDLGVDVPSKSELGYIDN